MNIRILLLLALLLVMPTSCKSTAASEVPCTCGTPMGDLEGCAHPLCVAGKHNPANPDCVCGTIDIKSAKKE